MGEDFLGLETLLVHGDQDGERALAPAIEASSTLRASQPQPGGPA